MRFLIDYGVWILLFVPVLVWELLAFFVHRGTLTHPTISKMIKHSEKGRIAVRFVWAAVGVVLFAHLVYPTF